MSVDFIPVTVVLDRTSLELDDLVLTNLDGGSDLELVGYREPATQARIRYSPSSDAVHGERALGFTWQQGLLTLQVAARGAASESAARSAIAALVAAVARLAYAVRVTVGDAQEETWVCDPGTVTPTADRDYVDLRDHDPVWVVTIPCHPIRSS